MVHVLKLLLSQNSDYSKKFTFFFFTFFNIREHTSSLPGTTSAIPRLFLVWSVTQLVPSLLSNLHLLPSSQMIFHHILQSNLSWLFFYWLSTYVLKWDHTPNTPSIVCHPLWHFYFQFHHSRVDKCYIEFTLGAWH